MAITAKQVKELREMTGAGMMDCKKALNETDGDMEAAVEVLRKKGIAAAGKRASKIAAEGLVNFVISEDKKTAAIVEVNSETDFVAKNAQFVEFVKNCADQAIATEAPSLEAFLAEKWLVNPEETVNDALIAMIATIKENLKIRRFEKITTEGYIGGYNHGQGKIGVLVEADAPNCPEVDECIHNVAMQIAAMRPAYICREDVPAEYMEHEKAILMETAMNEANGKKPVNIVEKMVEGRLTKQMKEICLLDQIYFKDSEGKQSVGKYIQSVSKTIGAPITIKKYVRFETGEGIEKKEENFAEEVAKQMQG